ncbi:MAG: heat-inducible transcription repressor HrcA [Chloroflexi bacterium]|nr:heat-inducible transcription repressor HrcA [Chloroflexota bacterium]
MEALTPRQQAILGLVVRAYVETAQPIGSKALVERYGLGYSPATVRNELAALEEKGYLTHPHTSAGRVPTKEGYRYFVEHLVGDMELSPEELLMIRHQFHQARMELDQWVRLAAAILARTARGAALATMPKAPKSRFEHLDLIALHDAVVLLMVVLSGGMVKQHMLKLDGPVPQEQLNRIADMLNERLRGATSEELTGRAPVTTGLERQIIMLVRDLMRRADGRVSDYIYRDGLLHVLDAPEFAQRESARRIVQVLEERPLLESILAHMRGVNTVQVIIGGEGRWEALQDVSLVLSRYGQEDVATGVLGIVGPIRMPYARAISAVRYVSTLMSDLLREWYGC